MSEGTRDPSPGAPAWPRLMRRLAWPTAAVIWAVYALVRHPAIDPTRVEYRVPLLLAVPFSLVCAYGLAAQAALFWCNRRRLRTVLRPTSGHIIAALVMGLLTPIVVFDWWPWISGPVIFFILPMALPFGLPTAVYFALCLIWYPFAANIVSGVRNRIVRVGVFALMFWAGYAGLVLWSGVRPPFSL